MNQTWENGNKSSVWPDFVTFGQISGRQNFYSKIWLRQSQITWSAIIMYNIRKKTTDPILRKLSDGRTDR